MTATEELRRMLDERGVEWDELVGHPVVVGTEWHDRDGYPCAALEHAYDVPDGMLSVQANLTPAQAIEATLGPQVQPPSMPEQPPYDVLIDLLRDEWDIEVMWDGLRRFWYVGLTDEGVRKRDEREATLGRATCRPIISDNLTESEGTGDAWANCSECGHLLCVLTDPSSQMPNYCPNCGRKVVDS